MQKFLVRSVFLALLLSAAESWALPPCPGSYNQYTWTNCHGAVSYDGSKYVGEWQEGLFRSNAKQTLVSSQLSR